MRVMAHDLMTASRTEDGCILYIMTESQGDETLFFLFMVWRDEEAYRMHSASPYVRAFDNEISHEILEKRYSVREVALARVAGDHPQKRTGFKISPAVKIYREGTFTAAPLPTTGSPLDNPVVCRACHLLQRNTCRRPASITRIS